ncbi:1-acyl-sn-glycerol-3-phosphate acyltransferase [Terrimonas pollutisoli]|uniref:1-acyl-sn-glycerol-3-phosphate acyltransferase n=1 Tax=Terrimonas pollutisoli TaxID=3034147 RepID=UPI0023ED733D|nr:1-acyl-sn-glycerol-3-phosphate acyltransferase [Terrimonas sp. H1YJ31]
MLIFCRSIIVNNRAMLKKRGPLLLASNHPNSFLDAIILDILFEQPIWSLARGDVFKNRWISEILKALKMFPVYRVSEGVENLNNNYETFENCKQVFRKNGLILIFSEGKCINEWRLRPLKKGTARLAISSWEENIPLQVLPVGINYSSFRRFGKNVFINFGEPISKEDIPLNEADGIRYQAFNNKLQSQLRSLVFEISNTDKKKKQQLLEKKPSPFANILLSFPAFLGWLTHFPLYLPIQRITYKKTSHNDHYDSVMAAALLFTYPLYLLVISFVLFYFTKSNYSFLLLLLLPLTAWSYVQVKRQLDK